MHAFQIAKRIFKQTVRDVRTLMLLLVAPILILSLLYYIFTVSDNANGLKVGVHQISDSYLEQLHDQDIQTKQYHDNNSIGQKIKDDQLTGFIYEKNHKLYVTYANDNPTETGTLASANQKWLIQHNMAQMKDNTEQLQQQLKSIQSKLPDNVMDEQQTNTNKAQVNKPVQMTSDYLYANKDATYFDMINPILIGFFVFFFTFLISGIGLLKERTSGTLERLLASPIKRSEIIFGYIMGYGLFSVIHPNRNANPKPNP